jgi:hypothetical protein
VSIPGLLIGSGVLLALIFVLMDDTWAAATNISLISAIMVLSIVVLTGYAGQLSLGQWALAGCGALIAGSFVLRFDMPTELAMPLGVLLTIVLTGLRLRTRSVNLAIVRSGSATRSRVSCSRLDWIGAGSAVRSTAAPQWGAPAWPHRRRQCLPSQRWAAVTGCVRARRPGGMNLRRCAPANLMRCARGAPRHPRDRVRREAPPSRCQRASPGSPASCTASAPARSYEQFSPLQSIFSVG